MHNLRFRQIHLDFHTSEKIEGIGDKFNAKDFAKILADAHVDSITCFSKCHHGMIYHDTKFEAKHPYLTVNLLKEQIEACHNAGIKAPVYISVGLDEFMAQCHPEWLEVTPDGKRAGAGPLQAGWRKFCFNSPYIDYVVEQTLEVLSMFTVDGLFFDIISQGQCCCRYCMEDMLANGYAPETEDDRITFSKKVLEDFKKRMSSEVRKVQVDCPIFYNSGHVSPDIRSTLDTYSHLELESLPSGGWGYHHFPITARYGRNLGLDYLGMTGKFLKSWADFGGYKNKAALEYECFTALSLGGKCSIGDQLHPSGEITKATYGLIGSVYESVEKKEEWCDDVQPQAEIAIFTPDAVGASQGRLDDSLQGAYRILEESHYQFDIIDGQMDMSKYKVIILPDKITIDQSLKESLNRFLESGGALMLSHASGMNASEDGYYYLKDYGIHFEGEAKYCPDFVEAGEKINQDILESEHVMYDRGYEISVQNNEEGEVLAEVWHPYFNRNYKHFCSHFHTPVEKKSEYPAIVRTGNLIYFVHPVFGMYQRHGAKVYKQLVLNTLNLLVKDKMVKTNAPTTAHITVNHQEIKNRYVMHILHYIPERRANGIDTIEDVIPLNDVECAVKLGEKVSKVYMAPSGEEIDFKELDGYVSITIPRVDGHQMVVFEKNS